MAEIKQLEIPAKQALNWLYERRFIPYDWPKLLQAASAKYDELKQGFPYESEHASIKAIGALLKDEDKAPAEYGTVKLVIDKLLSSQTEYGEKTFFGGYKHPLTKEWQVLLTIYEKGNLYWAEQGRFLQQATSFELTSLKKQMQGANKTRQDSQ